MRMRGIKIFAGNLIIMAGRELESTFFIILFSVYLFVIGFMRERKRAYDKNNLKEAASICNNIGLYYSQIGQ